MALRVAFLAMAFLNWMTLSYFELRELMPPWEFLSSLEFLAFWEVEERRLGRWVFFVEGGCLMWGEKSSLMGTGGEGELSNAISF